MANRTGGQVGVFEVYHIHAMDAVVTSGNLAEVLRVSLPKKFGD